MAGQTQSFAYDSNSNRTSAVINAATTSYTYPTNSHRLTSLSGATNRSFSYDNAGNVTASAGITYVYDGRGRMKQAAAVRYLVNGLGQRVKKAGASDTFFAYDEAGRLLGEYDAAGAPIQETIWLGDLPIAVIKPNATGFDAFYVWADHLGTPRQITDAANQSRWEWPNADPFGNNAPNENPAGTGAFAYNLRFPGQYFDAETGKHYNYYRDYDSSLGRYLQGDPIGVAPLQFSGEPVLNHLYAYVESNPLINTDQFGLQPDESCPTCKCWLKCIGDDPLVKYIVAASAAPLVNLKMPGERKLPGSSRWTSIDRRFPGFPGANPEGGATVTRGSYARIKCVGTLGTAAAGVGAFAIGYGIGASGRCLVECSK